MTCNEVEGDAPYGANVSEKEHTPLACTRLASRQTECRGIHPAGRRMRARVPLRQAPRPRERERMAAGQVRVFGEKSKYCGEGRVRWPDRRLKPVGRAYS